MEWDADGKQVETPPKIRLATTFVVNGAVQLSRLGLRIDHDTDNRNLVAPVNLVLPRVIHMTETITISFDVPRIYIRRNQVANVLGRSLSAGHWRETPDFTHET
jgi:hypothetical protein